MRLETIGEEILHFVIKGIYFILVNDVNLSRVRKDMAKEGPTRIIHLHQPQSR